MKKVKYAIGIFLLLLSIFIGSSGAGTPPKGGGASQPPASGTGQKQVAVYPFEAVGIDGTKGTVITNAVFRQLITSSKILVRDQASTQAAIESIGLSQSGHCADDSCKIEAGKILKAEKLIMGSVEMLDANYYTVSIRVVDVQTGRTEYSKSQDCPCQNIVAVRDLAITLTQTAVIPYLETGNASDSSGPNSTPPVSPPTTPPPAVVTPPEPQTGDIDISVNVPNADIYLDGQKQGNSSSSGKYKAKKIQAGQHKLTVTHPQYNTVDLMVNVGADRTNQVNVTMKGRPGSLAVSSTPSGAMVSVNGSYKGITPLNLSLDPGSYLVEVSMSGYTATSRQATIEGGGSSTVNIPLSKIEPITPAPPIAPVAPITPPRTTPVTPPPTAPPLPSGGKGGVMIYVSAGDFGMGYNEAMDPDELPFHRVYLDGYYIDKFEVTAGDYQTCLSEGGCPRPSGSGGGCNFGNSALSDNPMNCVDWEEARKFCQWAGKRLPTEAEWEKAARGTDNRLYPWGSQGPSCSTAIFDNGCGKKSTWPVGSKTNGASPFGVMDMAGNVFEWAADCYDSKYYMRSPKQNPYNSSGSKYHTLRGGSYKSDDKGIRLTARVGDRPSWDQVGFRCAK